MQPKKYQFSPSSLSLFKDCPRCFWLALNEKIKRPRTPFPSLPNGMDAVLKEFYDSFIRDQKVPEDIATIANVSLFGDEKKLATWRNNFIGIRTKDDEGNTIMGAIDTLLIDNKTQELIVLDFKTRSTPPNGNSYKYYVDQLTIYTWLLSQQGYPVANYGYLIFYYPDKIIDTGVCLFKSELVKVDIELARAPAIIAKARTCLQNAIPNSSETCEFCLWRNKQKKRKEQTTLTGL